MTERLRALVAAIETLPIEQQDQWAETFAQELADDKRWDELFARPESQTFFEQLIAEAEQGKHEGTRCERYMVTYRSRNGLLASTHRIVLRV